MLEWWNNGEWGDGYPMFAAIYWLNYGMPDGKLGYFILWLYLYFSNLLFNLFIKII